MKNIWTIMKKELHRVFFNPSLVLTMFILPGLFIYAIYGLLVPAIEQSITTETEPATVETVNMPDDIKTALQDPKLNFSATYTVIDPSDPSYPSLLDAEKENLKSDKVDLILVFSEDFEANVQAGKAASLEYYFNGTSTASASAYSTVSSYMSAYRKAYETSAFTETPQSIYDQKTAAGKNFAMLLPFLSIVFLFQSAASIGPESIAGEKERGTIATLLVSPVKRSEIALGKMFSLSMLCALSSISSFIGIIVSLPMMFSSGGNANFSALANYSIGDYGSILVILVSTVLILISLICILSAYAKSIKEAALFSMPIMIISMLVGIASMTGSGAPTQWYFYLIPIYNSLESMVGILTFQFSWSNFLVTILANLLLTAGFTYVLTREFSSEKVMFAR